MTHVEVYKSRLGIDWDGRCFEVHHLDLNHKNNDFDNLLLLPKKLHSQYHMKRPDWSDLRVLPLYPIASNKSGNKSLQFHMIQTRNMIDSFTPIIAECKKWADYKEFLLGNMPNIHDLSHEASPSFQGQNAECDNGVNK